MGSLGNKEIMAKNIKRYMAAKGVTQTDICKELNLKPATFSDWVNAKTYPRIDKIELLSNYFEIAKADLVEEKPVTNKDDEQILQMIKQLNDDNRESIMRLIRSIIDSHEE